MLAVTFLELFCEPYIMFFISYVVCYCCLVYYSVRGTCLPCFSGSYNINVVEIVAIQLQFNLGFWNTQIRSVKRKFPTVRAFTGCIPVLEEEYVEYVENAVHL